MRVRETDVRLDAGVVLHGLDTSGAPHLLVPVTQTTTSHEDRASAGVQIGRRVLVDAGTDRTYLDVVCRLPHLRGLFATVLDEMIEGLTAEPRTPVLVCRRVLDRWRELLERPREHLLGTDRLAALMAELTWVEWIAQFDPRRALEVWRGPLMDRADIVGEHDCVEVKATLAREGRSVEIHGALQLEAPEGTSLFLAFHRFEVRDTGRSVPQTIRALQNAGVDRHALVSLLARCDYSVTDAEAYEAFRFQETEVGVYRVDSQFPRIVPASFRDSVMPDRVSSLRYVVDLNGEPPTPIAPSEIQRLIQRISAAPAC